MKSNTIPRGQRPASQRMQVRDQIIELLSGDRIAERGHHAAAAHDGLFDEPVVGGQPAWEKLLLVESLQARAFAARRRIRVVASGAVALENPPPARLLRVQAQLGVGFRSRLAAVRNENQESSTQKNCRVSSQAPIIPGAAHAVYLQAMLNISSKDCVFVLTGAGISAESGIPTFRGAGSLWRDYRFEEVASPHAWQRDPRLVWEFYSMRRRVASNAKPNPGHVALAGLERALQERLFLCTQNVDNLHEQAGSSRVVHMHGELFKSRCDTCPRPPFDDALTYEPPAEIPRCGCGGRIRPHICWFGEVPYHVDEIFRAIDACTVFVAVGTSGVVEPAASFVGHVRQRARTIYVGPEEPANGSAFTEYYVGKAGEVLPSLFRCG